MALSKHTRIRKNKRLLNQVLTMMLLCITLSLVVCGVTLYSNSVSGFMEKTKQDTISIANYIRNNFEECNNRKELIDYWHTHASEMDVIYDNEKLFDASQDKMMDAAYELIRNMEKFPYSSIEDIPFDKMSSRGRKLAAEGAYMEYLDLFNDLKTLFLPKYLYMVVSNGEHEIMYLLTGALENEQRGERPQDIYKLGKTQQLDPVKYKNMFDAFQNGEDSIGTDPMKSIRTAEGRNLEAYFPLKDDDGTVLALICVSLDTERIIDHLKGSIMKSELLTMGVLLLSMLGLAYGLRKFVLRPVEDIQLSVNQFGIDKNLEKLQNRMKNIASRNEIGLLAEDMAKLGESLVQHINETSKMAAQKEAIDTELRLAARIQEASLSTNFNIFPPEWKLDLYASMIPAKTVGGDFYSFFRIDDQHMAMLIADVSGKGVPASLFMMRCKVALENECRNLNDPAVILENVNNRICENNDAEMFVTVWLGILNIETGVVRTANAGHEYPLIRKKDGTVELIRDKHGFVLGGMEGSRYQNYEIKLQPGDTLIVYTDGITEATDRSGQLFGMERLMASVSLAGAVEAKGYAQSINEAVHRFVEEEEQFDDQTMLILHLGS